MWTPTEYQLAICDIGYPILCKYGLVYLAMQERTGKSISGLCMTEKAPNRKKWLIASTLKGLYGIHPKIEKGGWEKTLAMCEGWLEHEYRLTTYTSIMKHMGWADGIILDEAHVSISAFPVQGQMWLNTRAMCLGKPVIFMSATPDAQGMHQRYSQLGVSDFSPWASYVRNSKKGYDTYEWYRDYALRKKDGSLYQIRKSGDRYTNDYTKINRLKVVSASGHLFITKTRAELGFAQEPEDVLHFIELNKSTKIAYNKLDDDMVLDFSANGRDYSLVSDTKMKIRTSQHMIEGGVLKVKDEYVILAGREKIDYILAKWGDTEDLAIMYNYKAEGIKLKEVFKKALILQYTSNAQGIDLSHIEHLVIYSQNFSTAQYSQARARQANKDRNTAIKVHFLLVKGALSEQVYERVAINKVNFIDSLYVRNKL